jgi:hypothetical protein
VPGQRLPHSNGLSLHPAVTSHRGATIHEASTKVHAIHPSGLPLARDSRMGQESFGFPLGLRTLPLPATHAKSGARHRARARNYAADIMSALLTASSLAKCDFVSQRHVSAPAEAGPILRRGCATTGSQWLEFHQQPRRHSLPGTSSQVTSRCRDTNTGLETRMSPARCARATNPRSASSDSPAWL